MKPGPPREGEASAPLPRGASLPPHPHAAPLPSPSPPSHREDWKGDRPHREGSAHATPSAPFLARVRPERLGTRVAGEGGAHAERRSPLTLRGLEGTRGRRRRNGCLQRRLLEASGLGRLCHIPEPETLLGVWWVCGRGSGGAHPCLQEVKGACGGRGPGRWDFGDEGAPGMVLLQRGGVGAGAPSKG